MRQGQGSETTDVFFCLSAKMPLYTGVRTGCHYLISLSVPLSVCVTFVVFTDCERCTRPISTNSGYMEAGEYGLTRWTCFVARRLQLVAASGLLWLSWCVVDGAFVYFFLVLSPNAHGLLASFTSLIVTRPFFAFKGKKVFSYGGACRVSLFN